MQHIKMAFDIVYVVVVVVVVMAKGLLDRTKITPIMNFT